MNAQPIQGALNRAAQYSDRLCRMFVGDTAAADLTPHEGFSLYYMLDRDKVIEQVMAAFDAEFTREYHAYVDARRTESNLEPLDWYKH